MGSSVSFKKGSKDKEDTSHKRLAPKNLRPISGVSEISEADSGYRSPEIHNDGHKRISQKDIFLHDALDSDQIHTTDVHSVETEIENNLRCESDTKHSQYHSCFTVSKSEENVFFLNGIDNEIDTNSLFDVDDLKKDSLRNIFIPGAVINYDKIIDNGNANELVARIEEEKGVKKKKIRRPQTARSTDIEIDLEKGTEKVRRRVSTAGKYNPDQNTRDPHVRPRAAHGQRRKTVSGVSREFINKYDEKRKVDEKQDISKNISNLNIVDAVKMLLEQNSENRKTDEMKCAYKIDISVDLNSDVLKIVLPGSYFFGAK